MTNEHGAPVHYLVATDDCEIFSSLSGPFRKRTSLGFLTLLKVYALSKDGVFAYAQDTVTGTSGWVRRDDVLTEHTPRSCAENDGTAAKVVVANRNPEASEDRIAVYAGPGESHRHVGKIPVGTFLYVYGMEPDEKNEKFLLAGYAPWWDTLAPNKVIAGWIREKECLYWRSNIAISFDFDNVMDRDPVPIFDTREDLEAYLSTGSTESAVGFENRIKTLVGTGRTVYYPVLDREHRKIAAAVCAGPVLAKSKPGDMDSRGDIEDMLAKVYGEIPEVQENNSIVVTKHMYSDESTPFSSDTSDPGVLKTRICRKAWLPTEYAGKKFLISWVMMNRNEFDEFVGILSGGFNLKNAPTKTVAYTIKHDIMRMTGKEFDDTWTLSGFIERQYGISEEYLSLFLHCTPMRLQMNMEKDIRFKSDFLKNVEKSLHYFRMLLEGSAGTVRWNEKQKKWDIIKTGNRDWSWTSKSGLQFVWVPSEFLP